ncbi:hypothetical protein TSUD_83130 [Trifolium subterraneum]|uniref:Uncharacterized protein n=1 Tax=Trifolium subterraneum TaxID=3900 RepID=A0A2Z6PBQ7_TRISU|nr:hypothetical protein TSUD_83130 [Trifolium subterraneum]
MCPSFPPIRFLYHRFAPLRPSSPPLGFCALSLSKKPSLLTTPWIPNLRFDSATHHQDEKTSQLMVNLKPPTLPPLEPPPTGFCLNHFSTDELLVTDCVFCRPHQNRHGCIGLGSSLLGWCLLICLNKDLCLWKRRAWQFHLVLLRPISATTSCFNFLPTSWSILTSLRPLIVEMSLQQ